MELVDIFPAFGLRIECGPVTLRAMRESDVPRVAELAAGGIHAEGAQPFLMPWNLSETQPLESLKFYYRTWAAFSPESWRTLLAVERERQDRLPHEGAGAAALVGQPEPRAGLCVAEDGELLGLHVLRADHDPVALDRQQRRPALGRERDPRAVVEPQRVERLGLGEVPRHEEGPCPLGVYAFGDQLDDSGHVGLAHGTERDGPALDAQTERGEDVDQFHVPQSTR